MARLLDILVMDHFLRADILDSSEEKKDNFFDFEQHYVEIGILGDLAPLALVFTTTALS